MTHSPLRNLLRNLTLVAALALVAALPARAEIRIQEVTSPGGIRAWLVEDHNLPFLALRLRFLGGTSLDAPGKRGATNLMAALIEEGAGAMDAQGFATARDALAAEFRFDADLDGVGVAARVLTENRDQALDLLRQALSQPRFDAPAIERVRAQVFSVLRQSAKDPAALASRAEMARAFGAHPYGSDGTGSEDSVAALTRDDLVAAWQAALARDRVFVAVAGDVTAAELGPMLDRLLGDLPATGAAQPGRAALTAQAGTARLAFPGPQATISFYQGGIRFEDPDYFAAAVLMEILGGDRSTARLTAEVREKRGLTYGVGAEILTLRQGEIIGGQLQVDKAKVDEAIAVIRDQWADVAGGGLTEAEVAAAKTYMTGAYPLRFDGNARIAGILVGLQILGLPPDYPATRNARIEAVTLADVLRVARRLIRPDQLFFTVVGPQDG